jgi:DNA repair protein RecO (recombination protein O)
VERFVERALVLGSVDFGEADRIVTLFTEGRGKLSAFAAGARKSKRRFAGALEPFTLLKASMVETRGSTVRLDSVEIERGFFHIREDLARIARGLYLAELCRELVRDREPHPELFQSAVEYLELLESKAAGPTSLIAFELSALSLAGLRPRFDACAICGGEPKGELRFDPDHGGVVCERCLVRSRGGRPVSAELAEGLARIQNGERLPLSPELRERARELLNLFISHQLGKSLKGPEFMRQIGAD